MYRIGYFCTVSYTLECVKLEDLITRNKTGKAVLRVPKGAAVLPPVAVQDMETDWVAAASNTGHLLLHPVHELPVLPKGKGVKIINIPSARAATREEFVAAITVLREHDELTVRSGKRHVTLKAEDQNHYIGERGRRGNMLPRGFRTVDGLGPAED